MEHLWKMGEGTASLNRQYAVGKDTFIAMAALYQGIRAYTVKVALTFCPSIHIELYGQEDGSVVATFEVYIALINNKKFEYYFKSLMFLFRSGYLSDRLEP